MRKHIQQTPISHYFPLYQFWLVPPEVKISPSTHQVCFTATQNGTYVWWKQHEWSISVFECHS